MAQKLAMELQAPLFETSAKDNKGPRILKIFAKIFFGFLGISEAFKALAEDISKNESKFFELTKKWMVGGTSNGIALEKNHVTDSSEAKKLKSCCELR